MNSDTDRITAYEARPLTGLGAIALAVGFNVPFALLAQTYDYPDILRRPAGEALDLFARGGAPLILTWHAFALTAFALTALAAGLAVTGPRLRHYPALTIGAAIAGALAGMAQAIGLWRWVFVVPELARAHGDPSATQEVRAAAEQMFAVLNAYGGVAIGEHLGQLLTASFALLVSALQFAEGRRATALIGLAAAALIGVGTGEGISLALGASGEAFSRVTIAGFMALTLWLIVTGLGLFRGRHRGGAGA